MKKAAKSTESIKKKVSQIPLKIDTQTIAKSDSAISTGPMPNIGPFSAPQGVRQPHGVSVKQEVFQGPIPSPNIFAGYKNIDPTFPNRIFTEFEKNSEHIRQCEEKDLNAKIARDKRGQIIAGIISVLLLVIVAISVFMGNIAFAGVSGLTFVGLIVKAFLTPPQQSGQTKIPEQKQNKQLSK